MKRVRRWSGIMFFVLLSLPLLWAQDLRSVNEPLFPPVCTKLTALLSAGNTPGTISSETQFDTARIQSAMNACPAGQAVELATDGGDNNAYLIGQLSMAKGVTLIVDAGVTVFASRNPADFDTGSGYCGTIQTNSNFCTPIITANRADGAGIMGYGTIDGRGNMPMLNGSGSTWWDLARNADNAGQNQNNPRLLNVTNTDRFTLYKIRMINSPKVHVGLNTDTNFTAWGVKVTAPYDARNSDGIDPGYSTNVTINRSFLSVGDDQIAVGGDKAPGAQYISITNNYLGNGHGISVGSYTSNGINRMLVNNIAISGNPNDSNATAVHVKSDVSRGGLVQHLTYNNICTQDVRYPIWLDPFYSGKNTTGSYIPYYKNILIQNLHAVQNTRAQNGGIQNHQVLIEGYSAAAPADVTLSNVVVDNISATPIASNPDFQTKYGDHTPLNAAVTLGPAPVNFASLLEELDFTQQNVTLTNNISTSDAPYSCPDDAAPGYSVFSPIGGELIPGPRQIANGSALTVQTQIFTAKDISYAEYKSALTSDPTVGLALPAPTGTVTVFDGATQVGQATLAATGKTGTELLTIPVAALSSGAHVLSAQYSGDSNYSAIAFGNYNVVVGGGAATSTSVSVQPGSPIAGLPVTFTATVSGTAPTGSVTFSAGSLNIGSAALVNGIATLTTSSLTGATYAVSAAYSGDATNNASDAAPISVIVTTDTPSITLTATPQTAGPSQPITLTARIAPSASNTLLPSGTVKFTEGSTLLGTVNVADGRATLSSSFALGTHTIVATYNGDVDFASAASLSATVTIALIATEISVACPDAVYDGTMHSCTAAVTGSDGKTVDGSTTLTYSGSATAPTAAGTYQVNASFTSADPAYGNSTGASSLTIDKATPAVSVTCPAATADGNPHACIASATGIGGAAVVGTISITYDGLATVPSSAGTYTVVASFISSDSNYSNASGTGSLTIAAPPAVAAPVITSLSPAMAPANTTVTLTVNGANFVPATVIRWNGAARSTTYISNTKLTASITYVDLQSVGTAEVSVFTPAPGGGTATALFAIDTATNTPGAITVTSSNSTLTVTRGQSATLQIAVSQQVASSGTAVPVLSVTCANLPAGVSCGTYNSSNQTVPVSVSSSAVPGTYQFTAVFDATQRVTSNLHSQRLLASWPLLGMPFAIVWIGWERKKIARHGIAFSVLAILLLAALAGCGGGSTGESSGGGTTVTSQSSVAITLTVN